ncbi:MAG: anthranilate synthase component I family protein [Bacteroidetes bacterium]|nr:anthranilate synthase component I family protein [Bacteroidota bacterium]
MHITPTYQLECLLAKARKEEFACILLSNQFEDQYGRYELMAGFGETHRYRDLSLIPTTSAIPLFGYVGYDYKNNIETMLHSRHSVLVEFDRLGFVSPREWVVLGRDSQVFGNANLLHCDTIIQADNDKDLPQWRAQTLREEYLNIVEKIKIHIVEGDFYEMNYCIAFSAEITLDPYSIFLALNAISPAPFSVFLKEGDRYLLCASPERFITQFQGKLISQPIKGTRRRLGDFAQLQSDAMLLSQDLDVANELLGSEKDRSENIMIVDLVRNDLSRICQVGSVVVPSLCSLHSFSHVHQLISTVQGIPLMGISLKDVFHATFPMGSMTGAPKIAVMQYAEKLENFSRGLYSGSVGYVWNQEFDFNVVIRALQYDSQAKYLAYAVGGAITYDSIAEMEYQECLDKAASVLSVFHP